MRLIKISP